MIPKLYEQDFHRWREVTITQIKEKNFQAVDWENLLIELENMSKSERRIFVSNLTILMAHLLKLIVQKDAPNYLIKIWHNSVTEHRFFIKKDLAENPSLHNYLEETINKAYKDARNLVIKEGKTAKVKLSQLLSDDYSYQCPFFIEQLLDDDFYG